MQSQKIRGQCQSHSHATLEKCSLERVADVVQVPSGNLRSPNAAKRHSLLVASIGNSTILKNTASKARFLFTGLSNTYKISVSATAHTSNISSPAIWTRLRGHNIIGCGCNIS